jgi:tRNA(fMet)-specific endonuclease VapC
MNRILLDTSAVVAFMQGAPEVVAVIREADEIYLSAVTVGQMLTGLAKNQSELARFLASPRVSLIDVDEGTAERYAVIFTTLRKAGTPIPTNDLWIAASAMQYGLRVLTRDSHFAKVPQILTQLIA